MATLQAGILARVELVFRSGRRKESGLCQRSALLEWSGMLYLPSRISLKYFPTLNSSQLARPDCRRFLLFAGASFSLADPQQEFHLTSTEAGHSKAEADDFVQRHSEVFEPLATVAHLTRAVRMLSVDEISELKLACAGFGAPWREGYRN